MTYSIVEMKTQLHDDLNWSAPAGELQHGDCLLDHLKDYLVCQKWGISEHTQLLSVLVRRGELTRERALEKAQIEERLLPPPILPRFLSDINMSFEEFEQAKTRHFTQIPNIRQSKYFVLGEKLTNRSLALLRRT